MRKKLTSIIILMMWLAVSTCIFAQNTDQVGTSMANFLKIGVGPKSYSNG